MAKKQSFYLETDFTNWLDQKSYQNSRSRGDIVSRMGCLNSAYLATFSIQQVANSISFWNMLESIITNKNGVKMDYLDDLMVAMQSRITKDAIIIGHNANVQPGTVINYSSAFSSYSEFILEHASSLTQSKNSITTDEDANIKNIQGAIITLSKKQLIDIFISRMNTQDRCSGNKVWLPLDLIGKIINKCKKTGIKIKYRSIREWSKTEAKKVQIHTFNGTVLARNVDELTIHTQSNDVYVISRGIKHRVYDPLLPGKTSKQVMSVNRIRQTHIDHIVEIDTILKTYGNQYNGLDTLTKWIKGAMLNLGIQSLQKNEKTVYDYILTHSSTYPITQSLINDIEHDIDDIAAKEDLQLSSYAWNTSAKKLAQKGANSTGTNQNPKP